jgi:hypothetical protein
MTATPGNAAEDRRSRIEDRASRAAPLSSSILYPLSPIRERLQRQRVLLPLVLAALVGTLGCRSLGLSLLPAPEKKDGKTAEATPVQPPPGAPTKHCVRIAPYLFFSDFEMDKEQPLFRDLASLRDQVCRQLHLPVGTATIQVYLFEDEQRYQAFLDDRHRNLPKRRAYFVQQQRALGGKEDLLVYTWMGPRIQQDLRHELTHALLHSVLKDVPLWLDEGLAEYFELPGDRKGVNATHLNQLLHGPAGPIHPDLPRLEGLRRVDEMNHPEYREAWAWVHLMLHGKLEARKVLLDYLVKLRDTKAPPPLAPRLAAVYPGLNEALIAHLRDLDSAQSATLAAPPP